MRHFYSALLTNHAGRHKDYSKWPTNVLIAYRVLIVLGGEIWCSFLSTHAFLLGNGQTYATRGVPYYRVSRIFMSRNFHPCKLVPHFHVPQFHVSHFQRPQNDIPIKRTQSLKTEPRIKRGNRLYCLQSTHVWKWPVAKYKHIKIKRRICILGPLFILCLTWTVNANSLKQNVIVIKQICSS